MELCKYLTLNIKMLKNLYKNMINNYLLELFYKYKLLYYFFFFFFSKFFYYVRQYYNN